MKKLLHVTLIWLTSKHSKSSYEVSFNIRPYVCFSCWYFYSRVSSRSLMNNKNEKQFRGPHISFYLNLFHFPFPLRTLLNITHVRLRFLSLVKAFWYINLRPCAFWEDDLIISLMGIVKAEHSLRSLMFNLLVFEATASGWPFPG